MTYYEKSQGLELATDVLTRRVGQWLVDEVKECDSDPSDTAQTTASRIRQCWRSNFTTALEDLSQRSAEVKPGLISLAGRSRWLLALVPAVTASPHLHANAVFPATPPSQRDSSMRR